ncbi:hypothetical protein RFK95_07690 [Acinetobacter pittii]|uniref:Lipoprotein n=1 Tax=Acinetobacter pittii TaxID=48296 RepID=A0A429K5T7_ACIPI|nr:MULTISPECIES: hypothetical protein [Acinetobacter]MDR0071125.1 hypothetical protein [Acinetobacter sp. 11520]MDU6099564.1 hypothetical protein [Acinetobacter sp.]AMM27310.1 hypothetical protein AYJ52_02125 [Acinetobacter pittii]EXA95377.1 hypothetical protein J507_3409 [Acinetobacter sp. 1295259]KQE11664.1 hypothetical protein APD36_16915 [Acinetobacter pittii]
MKLTQGVCGVTLAAFLTACGGGGNDGYYNQNSNSGSTTTPTTPSPNQELATSVLNNVKQEGKYLFGAYALNDEKLSKGYIDHALDTFAQGPLKLTLDIRKVDLTKYSDHYRDKCFIKSTTDYRACYVFKGEEIKTLLTGYSDWDFDITADDLKNIKLSNDNISPNLQDYQSNTRIYIFENENNDKNFQDVTITGAFAYPFQQSWGLEQTKQKRFVLINAATSDYKITTTALVQDPETGQPTEKEVTTGAMSVYKDNTSIDGDLYVVQGGSGFNVLINDNPNVPFAEPISFVVNSTPGNTNNATYKVMANNHQILSLPSITSLEGSRVENESPTTNAQKFNGSIYLEGQNIFTFKQSLNGTTLDFKHVINGVSIEGQSINQNGTVSTTLKTPFMQKFTF